MIDLLREPFRRRSLAELLYVLLAVPLGVPAFVYAVAAPLSSLALLATLLGFPLLVAGVRGARGLGGLYRWVAFRLLGLRVTTPIRPRSEPGVLGWVKSGLRDTSGWRSLAYLATKLPIAAVTCAVSLFFWGYGLAFATYPLWWRFLPAGPNAPDPGEPGLRLGGDVVLDTWASAVFAAILGLILLCGAPWVVRGLVVLDKLLIGGLLSAATLSERVRNLEHTRDKAVADAAASLRRIERDLHDGTQARLVTLAMKIGLAKDELAGVSRPIDLARARTALDAALASAKTALGEVRDLARGIHPPALDRGLDAALATLAARSPVPVELRVELPSRPSAATESIAYYCVAELLTNVAKHSGANRATVNVAQIGERMRVRVTDDGNGGASGDHGSGLAGLAERVHTVDGRLDVASPQGGPTVVEFELPTRA
jgi:signal transduction histidine kinase